jgi:hypothetical protein
MKISIYKYIFAFVATVCLAGFFAVPVAAAANNVGDVVTFHVDSTYDASGRSNVAATLVQVSPYFYFYVESNYWDSLPQAKRNSIGSNLISLSNEFATNIYPKLTATYGFEWNPGIDNDSKITLLFQSTAENLGGYFRSNDEYSRLQVPDSNEREMLYIPVEQLDSQDLKIYVAHEFSHMIIFNQKDRMQNVDEEVWLNEGMADFSSSILGYDDVYDGSNLKRRVDDFLKQPGDSLTEWKNTKYDYASVSLFLHYLVDRYGINVLTLALHSKLTGIASINDALSKMGAKQNFPQVFTNWTITLAINNCAGNTLYCYTSKYLTDLKISPSLIFLPLMGDSSLSLNNSTKDWAGNWQKIIGGKGNLKLQFSGMEGLIFKVPYLTYDKAGGAVLNFLALDSKNRGEIALDNFDTQYNSLVILPSLQSKLTGSEGSNPLYPYKFTISINNAAASTQEDQSLIKKLQDQIEALQKQLADLQSQNSSNGTVAGCGPITMNLYFRVTDSQVSCLQQALKAQGQDIYPEGLITRFFGSLTRSAVLRFQKKYGIVQTGYVGPLTRAKINQLIQ